MNLQKITLTLIVTLLLLPSLIFGVTKPEPKPGPKMDKEYPITLGGNRPVKNVIILIPDGCGVSHITIARHFKGEKLAQDAMDAGLMTTYSANSVVTGSAAAATAFGCGVKTTESSVIGVKCLGILPGETAFPLCRKYPVVGTLEPDMQWKPVASVLEAARLRGLSTGLIATSRITHATPAGFSAHWHDRGNDNVIMEQQVYQNIDVVFGGGGRHLIPSSISGGKRSDGENLLQWLQANGYDYITTRTQLQALPTSSQKVWGMFNSSHMAADINRKYFAQEEPSLAEMTQKAIDILSKNNVGFLLVVEGSQVDWASHNNDPVGTVTEYIAFDSAVAVAMEFAKSNKSTEVIVFPDHDNGGMSLSRRYDGYTDLGTNDIVDQLKKATITSFGLLDTLIRYKKAGNSIDFDVVVSFLQDFMDIEPLTSEDTADVENIVSSVIAGSMGDQNIAYIGEIISRRCHIGWTTFGHTGNDVPVHVFYNGQRNRKPAVTLHDNTDVAWHCVEDLMRVDLVKVNDRLYNEANELFSTVPGAAVTVEAEDVNSSTGSVTVTQGDKKAVFPLFKNLMIADNDTTVLEGLVTYSLQSKKAYLPAQAKKAFEMLP